MNKFLTVILCIAAVGIMIFLFPDGPAAVLIGGMLASPIIIFLSKQPYDKNFLFRVFLVALLLRIATAIFINVYSLQDFFGPDSNTYDAYGMAIANAWSNNLSATLPPNLFGSGWGMPYLVGIIYFVIGQNNLAIQFFCAVLGAATVPAIYYCSIEIFSNRRVARIASAIVAVSPSMIIWSSQALKDGLIVFFLVLSVVSVLQLQKKFNYLSFLLLLTALGGILSLRFYIFYMLLASIIGSFILGSSTTPSSLAKRLAIFLIIGVGLTVFGVPRSADKDLSQFNLQKVQTTREDLARGNAGFGREADVSTTGGALSTLPLGFTYLMLAPFPWQLANLRQSITLPEMLAWWGSIPFLIMGLWYSIKNRLRSSIAVLLFTLMLTIAYSLYQGNVGTAYRQRAQIQIFHFMFIAVGFTIWREKRENAQALKIAKRNETLRRIKQSRMPDYLDKDNSEDMDGNADSNNDSDSSKLN